MQKLPVFISLLCAAGLALGSVSAKAQEIIEDETVIYAEEPAIVEDSEVDVVLPSDDAVVVEEGEVAAAQPETRTRVYGWSSREGGDCGTFHYWNGVRCADARVDPPRAD